jgi:hypothetical protein
LTPIFIGMHRNAPLSLMKEGARVHHSYGSYAPSTYGSYEPRRENPSTAREPRALDPDLGPGSIGLGNGNPRSKSPGPATLTGPSIYRARRSAFTSRTCRFTSRKSTGRSTRRRRRSRRPRTPTRPRGCRWRPGTKAILTTRGARRVRTRGPTPRGCSGEHIIRRFRSPMIILGSC